MTDFTTGFDRRAAWDRRQLADRTAKHNLRVVCRIALDYAKQQPQSPQRDSVIKRLVAVLGETT